MLCVSGNFCMPEQLQTRWSYSIHTQFEKLKALKPSPGGEGGA